MKTINSFLFAIVILLSTSACSSYLLVQKTYDPEINLGGKPYKIVLVNLFDYTSPGYIKEKQQASYNAGIKNLADGLSSSFSKDTSLSFFVGDTLKKDIMRGQLTAFLPKDTIHAICERQKTDMLLTLDSLNIYFDWEIEVNDDGASKEKVKNFYLYTRFYLSFYSGTGNLINRSMMEKHSLYKSRVALSALITIKPSIANAIEAIKTLSFQAGQDYVRKFYPKTVQESRTIYAGKAFKESNLFIKLRNWDKATELLEQLAKSADPNTAMKARHNLSVVKEAAALESIDTN
jgi:hypothetical protein